MTFVHEDFQGKPLVIKDLAAVVLAEALLTGGANLKPILMRIADELPSEPIQIVTEEGLVYEAVRYGFAEPDGKLILTARLVT